MSMLDRLWSSDNQRSRSR